MHVFVENTVANVTVSQGKSICGCCLGLVPFLLLCCFCGKTQIWLGDLRVVLVLWFLFFCVGDVLICRFCTDQSSPCTIVSHCLRLFQDRALVRHRPIQRKKNRGLFDRFDQFFVPLISQMNDEMQLGALGEDVEMDEISFCSLTVESKVHWIRFLACAKRGSSFVHLYKLPNRVTASGQGGGGPLSLEELGPALRVGTQRPLLKGGSVVHIDSAKAYKHLSEDEVLHTWMVNGALASFEDLKLGHTNVRHKPPHPEFSKVLQTRVWNGRDFVQESRVGGTQKCDGFFASFRREVGKRPLNTVGLCATVSAWHAGLINVL